LVDDLSEPFVLHLIDHEIVTDIVRRLIVHDNLFRSPLFRFKVSDILLQVDVVLDLELCFNWYNSVVVRHVEVGSGSNVAERQYMLLIPVSSRGPHSARWESRCLGT
jgi:hypothetical protein